MPSYYRRIVLQILILVKLNLKVFFIPDFISRFTYEKIGQKNLAIIVIPSSVCSVCGFPEGRPGYINVPHGP